MMRPCFNITCLFAALLLVGCHPKENDKESTKEFPHVNHSPYAHLALLLTGHGADSDENEHDLEDNAADPKALRIVVEHDHIPEAVIALFEKETGIKVYQEIIQSEWGELASLLNAMGRNDLFLFDDWAIQALVREGKLAPIDHTAVPNLKNIAPEFLNLPGDPGNKYSVPYLAGILGIVVNTDLVKQEVKRFKDVFRPEFKKKIWLEYSKNNLVQMAWLSNHPALPNAFDESALDSLKPLMTEWLSLVKKLGNRTPMKPFMEEKVSLGILWSGQAREILNQRPQYKWIVPSGTTFAFIDSFALPKGGAHQADAEAFMNFLLRPDIGKIIAESTPYASPNAAALALIPQAELANQAAYPPADLFRRMSLYQESGKEQLLIDNWFQSLNDND